MTRYQVVGECAHVVAYDHTGVPAMTLLYKGAYLPEGVDPARLKHLIDSGLVAEEPEVPVAPNASVEQEPVVTGDGMHPVVTEADKQAQRAKVDADSDVEAKRAAARSKLPADGSAPHGNAAHEVWVEYAVSKGMDRDEAEKASPKDLKDALK